MTDRTVALMIRGLARVAALCLVLSVPWAYDSARMQLAAERLGPRAVASLPALQSLLQPAPQADDETQLAAVNEFFNRRIVFRDDTQAWGQTDRWTSPLELLDKGEGDCEDYVIARYFSLLALGMPAQRLRLVYVRAHVGGESIAHMVLAYYAHPGAEPLILDNLVGSVRPASRRPDLTPVFSFNSDGMWEGAGSQSAGHPSRLSRWREVLTKAQAEGFF